MNEKELRKERKKCFERIEEIDKELERLSKEQVRNNFKNKICSWCKNSLSESDIKNKSKYCEECRDNDSSLEYHCYLELF